MNIGGKIKEARELINITQAELARKAGMKEARLALYEQSVSMPSVGSLSRIADSLNKPIEYFFENKGQQRISEF
jgi:transcriptional regulator with XRE-family HTH domain